MFARIRQSLSSVASLLRIGTRSLENPSTPLSNPDEWLWEAFGAIESATGVRINAESALKYAPWWRGINLVSRDVAKLPLFIYRRVGSGKERDIKHPAFRLLRYRANDELVSAFTFKQTVQAHAMSFGNGYAWIRRDKNAVPLELIIIAPMAVTPFRENGRLWYGVRVDGVLRRVNPTDILHIKGLSSDGLVGYSVYDKARDSIGEGMAAQQYTARGFKNNARPSVVIEVPGNMSVDAQKQFLTQWASMHAGIENSHRTAILTAGAKVNPFSANAEQSQLEELRKLNLVDVADWMGVPVHKVGGEGRTAFASLEQENQSYLDESLDPWLVCWESECWEKLLTEREKDQDTHVIEFMRQALVRADMVARYTSYNIGVRGGWLNPDMVLAKENENPIPNGLGKNFFRPLELAVVKEEEDVPLEDVQQTALNGAQIASLLSIAQGVADGSLAPDSAKAMIEVAFPTVSAAEAQAIIGPLEDWEQPAPVAPVSPFAPAPADDEPATDAQPPEEVTRRLILDATRRACRYVRIQFVRRAKLAGNFVAMIDEDRADDESHVQEIVGDTVRLLSREPAEVASLILDETKAVLLSAADAAHNRDELSSQVESRMTELESALPDRVADLLLPKGAEDGTPVSAD